MIADLKPYPAMKDSGVPWLGQMPEHWRVLPNRALFVEVKERDHPAEQMLSVTITKGVIRQQALLADSSKKDSSNQDKSAYKLVRPGDIAYNKMRAWQGAIGVSDYQGIVSPAYVVQRPREGADSRYFHYLLRTPAFAKEAERCSYGITSDMWSLRPEHFKMIYGCLPPLPEQAAIVRFLDHADRRIRRYIRAKQKLIKLLEEQKQAIIHRAVTRGLDPNVRLKPSGVEWLGDVPEHWEVKKLKFVKKPAPNSFVDGPFGSNLKSEHYVVGGDAYVVESGFITSGRFVQKEFKTITAGHFETIKRSECSGGDIIIAKIGARYGMAGVLPDLDKPAVVSGNSLKLTVNAEIATNRYVHAAVLTARALGALETIVNATAQPALSLGALNDLALPMPSLAEQSTIMLDLDRETIRFDATIDRAQREISLLSEYRTRLIADVVTGKVDVREAAARLPEEAGEPEALEEADALTDAEEETEVVEEPEE